MEGEGLLQTVSSSLAEKEGLVFRKAQTILSTILDSNKEVKSADERTLSLFVVGSLYRLAEKQSLATHIEPLLILLHDFLGGVNFKLLNSTPVVPGLISKVTGVLVSSNHSFLASKYGYAVLTELMLGWERPQEQWGVFEGLIATSLVGAGFDRKESTKCLDALLNRHPSIRRRVGESCKQLVEQNFEQGKQTHVTSLSKIIKLFPMELANDIAYLCRKKLSDEEDAAQRTQIYFLLDSLFEGGLVTSSVSEEILKQLVSSIPNDHDNERLLFGYGQALYQNITHLHTSNPTSAKRYLSTCISTLSEMLLISDKVAKQTELLLKQMLSNCINSGLWTVADDDILRFETMNLEGEAHVFSKVICMLTDLLSSRYEIVRKAVFNILGAFADALDENAFEFVKPFITDLENMREDLPEHLFSELFGKLATKLGIGNVLDMYPVAITRDPSDQQFDEANNLWMLQVISKHCQQGPVNVFLKQFLPVISQCKAKASLQKVLLKRNIYLNVLRRLWETLATLNTVDRRTKIDDLAQLLDEAETSLNPTLEYFEAVVKGIASLAPNLPKKDLSKRAEKLIPVLAKLLNVDSPLAEPLLKTVSAFSLVCTPDYLDRVFEKNVLKLLSIKENGELSSNPDSHRNLEILIAISRGVNFNDSRVLSNNISKEECVLKLITELLAEDNSFQKKAYKYLSQAIEYMPEGFLTEALSVLDGLSGNLLIFAKSYRIGMLKTIWQRLGLGEENGSLEEALQFVKKYLPEIIVSLRESNSRLRRVALSLFGRITDRMVQLDILQHFVEMMCSGLASNSTSVKTDTIHALTITLNKFDMQKNEKFVLQLTEVLLVLLKEKKKEIYKGILLYLRQLFLKKLDKSKQLEILPQVLKALFEEDEDSKNEHRNILRFFLLKLTKRHSQSTVTQMLPEEHRRIIRAIVRAENKLKKKKREQKREYRLNKAAHAAQRKDSTSSEQEEAAQEHAAGGMEEQVDEEELERREKARKNNLLLKYDLHKENFHFVEDKRKKQAHRSDAEEEQETGVGYEDGRIVFREVAKRKRQQNEEEAQDIEQEQAPRKKRKVIRVDTIHQVKQSGSSFKATRAGGDVRLKNKPEPYAFIQLSSKALNKRYRHRAEKVFQSIFQRKEGGLKGLRTKLLAKN